VLKKEFTWNETIWNPSMISTALWLDGSDNTTIFSDAGTTQATNDAAVQQWKDKSGNQRSGSQNTAGSRPTYSLAGLNNKPAIIFSSSKHLLLANFASSTTSNNWSLFVLANPTATTSSKTEGTGGVDAISGICNLIGGANGGSDASAGLSLGSNFIQSYEHGAAYAPVLAQAPNASPLSSIYELNLLNKQHRIYKNSSLLRSGLTSPKSAVFNRLASVGDSFGWGSYEGAVGEIIVTPGAPSSLLRSKIEGYLAHKWGLTANLPSDHPYKTVGPTP